MEEQQGGDRDKKGEGEAGARGRECRQDTGRAFKEYVFSPNEAKGSGKLWTERSPVKKKKNKGQQLLFLVRLPEERPGQRWGRGRNTFPPPSYVP